MRGGHVLALLLVGLAVVLVTVATAPVDPEVEDPGAKSAPQASDGDAPAAIAGPERRVTLEWASWRTGEAETEETGPETDAPSDPTDPRLRRVLDGLRGVDVYVEKGNHGGQ